MLYCFLFIQEPEVRDKSRIKPTFSDCSGNKTHQLLVKTLSAIIFMSANEVADIF